MVTLFVLHFLADFILQSREMGKKKSVEFLWLLKHLFIQYAVFRIGLSFMGMEDSRLFALFNALIHGVIDWNIWKLYKLSVHYRITRRLKGLGVYGTNPKESLAYKITYEKSCEQWEYWEDHLFYTTIGFDQMLHAITLYALWTYL